MTRMIRKTNMERCMTDPNREVIFSTRVYTSKNVLLFINTLTKEYVFTNIKFVTLYNPLYDRWAALDVILEDNSIYKFRFEKSIHESFMNQCYSISKRSKVVDVVEEVYHRNTKTSAYTKAKAKKYMQGYQIVKSR